ncbi:unnamed protein product, partial [Rotaria sp. Silwood1]
MNKKKWTDPKEKIVGLDGLTNLVQQLDKHADNGNDNVRMDNNISNNYQNIGDQGNMEIDERNMNINDKNTGQHHKRGRNLTDRDGGIIQSPKNRRTPGDF